MPVDHPAWIEHQRKRWMVPNAERFWRPDAARFMTPEAARQLLPESMWLKEPPRQHKNAEEPARRDLVQQYETEPALLKAKSDLAWLRFKRAYLQFAQQRKAYDPNQPRILAGNLGAGRWTDGDSAASGQRRVRLAGDLPTEDTPEIPKERPSDSRERYAVAKAAARFLVRLAGPLGTLGMIVEGGHWLYEYDADIKASLEGPKSLQELHDDVSRPGKGYHVHHIVEQDSARQDGYSKEVVDGRDNRVRISAMKHREITGWYQTKNEDFGGLSPRDYLKKKAGRREEELVSMPSLILEF